ncbi:MAG: hypothetical protein HYZ17_09920 [Betaproteobacteria bacterium]|nr:hypothetical protein [Betaproteobacteria bacterium]
MSALPDPRIFPAPAIQLAIDLASAAEQSLAAPTMQLKDALDEQIRKTWSQLARQGAFAQVAEIFQQSPSVAVTRHWWRRLDEALHLSAVQTDGVGTQVFALPLVIVVGAGVAGKLSGVLPEVPRVVSLLQEHGALRGNRNFALGNALVPPEKLAIGELGALLQHGADPLTLPLAPMDIQPKQESVYLRFLIGAAVAAPSADLLGAPDVGAWGMALAQELARQLAAPGVTVLVLPRPPAGLLSAAHQGRQAQREVALQLFASNAIRKMRSGVGEPTAVLSMHRVGETGGELRVSLSSPFDPRSAEGFRIPLEPLDRVADVAQSVVDLLRDCRVNDVRLLTQVQPDRDTLTGGPLLFKPENIGPNEVVAYRSD